ncbi:hypothetical protein P3T76_006780 [Phytophthora citrophthora]|uniref:DUF7492 domain-containing protein n=1 Tax=Phytophthora citrophthora TaxID=4793 RepID=A0AAD9GPJ6_9STRA|nr:hypothetical protein P3T76_006780 [Phytophthora citrophthora]
MQLWSVYVAALATAVQLGKHSTTAHSWIDCFDTNRTKIYDESASYIYGGSGGNGFCDGYGAGYPGRGDTDIGTGYTFKMLENEVEAGTAVCETVDADTYTNTDWRKRISVAPGVTVYYAYLPNGHIVKDKKAIGTQHGIYWTGEAGSSLTSTLEMTKENLMDGYTLDFDDGNCGETYDYNGNPGGRAGDGKPCIGSFVVPTGTAPGIYSMVWYWTFWLDNEASYVDQSQARGYFGAAYSTCFEVEVTSGSGSSATTTVSPITNAPGATTATPQTTTADPQPAPEATTAIALTAIPVTEAPLLTAAPVATTETPASTTSAPITSWDQVDSNTAAGDAEIPGTPISTTSAPQLAIAMPVSTTAPPATTSAPALTTAAPTETPVSTTTSPVTQTEAPIATTSAPVVETSVPVTQAPQATTSVPAAVTEAPEQTIAVPSTTTVIPTETTDVPMVSGGSDSEHSSPSDTTTFSSFNSDEGSVGTVRPASASSSASTSYSSSNDSSLDWEVGSSTSNSSSSDNSTGFEVGSDSYEVEPERSSDSDSITHTPTQTSAASSSSTTSASANAETSFTVKTSPCHPWLALAVALIVAVAAF